MRESSGSQAATVSRPVALGPGNSASQEFSRQMREREELRGEPYLSRRGKLASFFERY